LAYIATLQSVAPTVSSDEEPSIRNCDQMPGRSIFLVAAVSSIRGYRA